MFGILFVNFLTNFRKFALEPYFQKVPTKKVKNSYFWLNMAICLAFFGKFDKNENFYEKQMKANDPRLHGKFDCVSSFSTPSPSFHFPSSLFLSSCRCPFALNLLSTIDKFV